MGAENNRPVHPGERNWYTNYLRWKTCRANEQPETDDTCRDGYASRAPSSLDY